ncbi:MAG: helix-turn-helix domain-containing protein [Lachnospiraceae bacterium]|nr:helix-turn-helix domain-containing protein [Lachnospiraceae bacterium]
MTIGERILEMIQEKGITQKEFSEKTGIPQSTMSSWKGKKRNPGMSKLQAICDVLGVDPYYLISGTKVNESVNTDYLSVYRTDKEEYELLVEYRKLGPDGRKRLKGYLDALTEMEDEQDSNKEEPVTA